MSASFALLDIMGQNTVTEQHLLHALVMVCSQSIMLQERKKEFFRRTLRMKNSVAASNISRGQLVSVHWRKIRLSGVSEMNLMISTSKP